MLKEIGVDLEKKVIQISTVGDDSQTGKALAVNRMLACQTPSKLKKKSGK